MICPLCGSSNTEETKCLDCQGTQINHPDPQDQWQYIQHYWEPGLVEIMHPQPIVKRIDCGWDISGVPCFMGTAEYHIKTDERFGRKGIPKKKDNGEWVWLLSDQK